MIAAELHWDRIRGSFWRSVELRKQGKPCQLDKENLCGWSCTDTPCFFSSLALQQGTVCHAKPDWSETNPRRRLVLELTRDAWTLTGGRFVGPWKTTAELSDCIQHSAIRVHSLTRGPCLEQFSCRGQSRISLPWLHDASPQVLLIWTGVIRQRCGDLDDGALLMGLADGR